MLRQTCSLRLVLALREFAAEGKFDAMTLNAGATWWKRMALPVRRVSQLNDMGLFTGCEAT